MMLSTDYAHLSIATLDNEQGAALYDGVSHAFFGPLFSGPGQAADFIASLEADPRLLTSSSMRTKWRAFQKATVLGGKPRRRKAAVATVEAEPAGE